MGGGEQKAAWVTRSGGMTWEALPELPLSGSPYTLCGFWACEDGAAALSLATPSEENWPLVHVLDGGVWLRAELPWTSCGLGYAHGVGRLDRTDGGWALTVTQQPYEAGEAVFEAPALTGPWTVR